jgi:carbon-monoxide dehydrogenase medium subunit
VAVAAARAGESLRVVVGACAEVPQHYPDICASGSSDAREIGERYAERLEPLSDSRGSADYRRRVVAVEVRRAIEAIEAIEAGE